MEKRENSFRCWQQIELPVGTFIVNFTCFMGFVDTNDKVIR